MVMSNFEIVRDYKQAKDPNGQIKILAQLNACSVQEICDILKEEGVDWRKLPRPRNTKPETEAPIKPTAPPKPTFNVAEHTLTSGSNENSSQSNDSSAATESKDKGNKPKRPYNRKPKAETPNDGNNLTDVLRYIKGLRQRRAEILSEVDKIDRILKEIGQLCAETE